MARERDVFIDGEINIREYLLAVLRKWYLVVSVLVAVVVIAWLIPRLSPEVPQYEARTKLLIGTPVGGRLLDEGTGPNIVVTNLSIGTLVSLATANDLLQKIIAQEALFAEDPASSPMNIDQLAGMLNAEVESASGDAGPLPLLTMTVRGGNPLLVQRIANKWAEVFVQQNSELFTIQAVGSYEFILEQYRETLDTLSKLGQERIKLTGESPLVLLENELEGRQDAFKQHQEVLLNLALELTLKSQGYKESVIHLNELTHEGSWIGLQNEEGANSLLSSTTGSDGSPSGGGSVRVNTPEQTSVIQARERFFTLQEKIKEFHDDSRLQQLNQRLDLKRASLEDNIIQLEIAENDVRTLSRTLQALEIEIGLQPKFLVLSKAITTPALWQLLGPNPDVADWERLGDLVLRTEEQNPAFTSLTNRIIETRTSLETERERFDILGQNLELTLIEIQSLEEDLNDKEGIQLPRIQNQLKLARSAYEQEQDVYDTLRNRETELRADIRQLQPRRDEYQKLVDTYRADAKGLAKQIAETKLKMSGIDRQIVPLESTLGVVSARLQEARIANADQPVSIRIVETAVQPQSPLPAGRGMSIPLAAILGLSLGIVLALFVHYLQNPQPVPEKSTT